MQQTNLNQHEMHISSKAAVLPSTKVMMSPFSPFSPISPNSPMTTAPTFALRQSITNLVDDMDIEQLSADITSDASTNICSDNDEDDFCTFSTKDLLVRLSEQDLLSHEGIFACIYN